MNERTIAVVGNPNCGKTTLFNALTGAKQRVGNWPGVTVDRREGAYQNNTRRIQVVDTPGIYSLSAASLDEAVTRDFVLSGKADLIVNIVDASNIERNLYLTAQLLEMRAPLLIALNMMDIAREGGIDIDVDRLAEQLGCPVIPMVASKKQGLVQLKDAIDDAVVEKKKSLAAISYPLELQEALSDLRPRVETLAAERQMDASWLALKLLEGDEQIGAMVGRETLNATHRLQQTLEEKLEDDAEILIATARYGFISWLLKDTVKKSGQIADSTTDRLDKIFLNRTFGIPVFLAVMYLMFMFTINLGGAFIDFFDIFAGAVFVDGFAVLLESIHAPEWMIAILAGGIGGGIQTMATFIPPIGFMFLFLSFLEDSGYMARAAFVMDRFMRIVGLPGKSFIPMLVGFGCNVPAIMATRTLESERDRTLTIMMNPFMSCGARLPVYALFAAAFFPNGGQNLVFVLYLIGIGFAILTGLILKTTVLKGDITPFIMELPPYHLPTVKAVVLRAVERLKTFLFKAGKVLIPVIVVLAFLNSMGTNGSFGNEDTENSALASIAKTITPALRPFGVTDENWPATVGVFTGIFAKEAVVGTLDALYANIDASASVKDEGEAFRFLDAIGESFASIPANLAELGDSVMDPLGLSIGDVRDIQEAAGDQEVRVGTFGSMVTLFGTKAAAFAYLLFILLYFPCCAAIAAVYRETNLRWTLFAGFWTTFMAYFGAVFFYQAATFGSHPLSSSSWIAAMMAALGIVLAVMRGVGKRGRTKMALAVAAEG